MIQHERHKCFGEDSFKAQFELVEKELIKSAKLQASDADPECYQR